MRKLFAFLALAGLVAISMTMQGCGQKKSPTAPSMPSTSLTEGQLPLVNGQGPPQETPPDSIVARAEKILGRQAGPMSMIAGVSGTNICNNATTWIGVRYLWGGNSRSGIDCSHLVWQVYHQSGIGSYPYVTTSSILTSYHFMSMAYWDNGGGDIVLFRTLGHMGIYMGNGWMIDANSVYGVTWDNLNSSYWQQFHPYPVRYTP